MEIRLPKDLQELGILEKKEFCEPESNGAHKITSVLSLMVYVVPANHYLKSYLKGMQCRWHHKICNFLTF